MKLEQLRNLIQEEIKKALEELEKQPKPEELGERTVASREPPRKMSKGQVQSRDKIGKAMLAKPKVVNYYKKKFGQEDWESYLWAAATNQAVGN